MNRRDLLATLAGSGLAVPLAGCSSPLRTDLRHDVVDDGPGETVVRFLEGDSRVATMDYQVGRVVDRQVRFRASLSHDLKAVRSFRLRFRPAVGPNGVPPRVYLRRPGGYPFPPYRFESQREFGWTLFEVPDLGPQAEATFTVEFRFDGVETDSLDVSTDLHAELDAGLDPRTVVADASVTASGYSPDGQSSP
ncbi:MAG: hypothetical protein ABEJ28_04555 [Salinigranum sp.]